MPNIVLKSEDQVSTIYTFTKVWLGPEIPNQRWVEHQVGGKTGGIVHFTGTDNSEFLMRALISSHADVETLKNEVLAGNIRYLDASAYDDNVSGKVYIVEFSPRKVKGDHENYIVDITFRRYNN